MKDQKWPETLPLGALNGQTHQRFAGLEPEISITAGTDTDTDKRKKGPEPELRAEPVTGGIRFTVPSGARGGAVYTVSYTARFEVSRWVQFGPRGRWVKVNTYTKPLTTKVLLKLAPEQKVHLPESGQTTFKLPASVRALRVTPSSKRVEAKIDADRTSVHLRATGDATKTSVSLKYDLDGKSYTTKLTVHPKKVAGGGKKQSRDGKKQGREKGPARPNGSGEKAG